MPSNFKVGGTDLDTLLAPRAGSTARADVGFKSAGVSVSDRWFASTGGDTISGATNHKSAGTDLQSLFRDISYTATSAPTITSNPSNHTGNEGTAISLMVVATGSPTLTYQWRKGGVAISGATAASFGITSPVYTDAGSYDCVVTNAYGSATSSAATVTVHQNVYVDIQPISVSGAYGDGVSFSVVVLPVLGPTDYVFEWYEHGVFVGSGTIDPSGTGSTLTPSVATLDFTSDGSYYCVITSPYGVVVTTNTVYRTTNASLAIDTQPADLNVPDGVGPYALQVAAHGDGALSYQWYKNGSALVGATGYQHVVNPALASTDYGDYFCVVSDGFGHSVTSNSAHIWPYPVIDTQPTDLNVPDGTGPYAFHADSHSSAGVSYQWFENGSALGGATGDQHVFYAAIANNGYTYFCRITDGNGLTRDSNVATLTVY